MRHNAEISGVLKTPFDEQIAFFRQKLNLPSERWDDIWQAAHDRAFIVAGAAKADLLADLRAAVDAAIAEGKSIGWFRKEFDRIVQKHGWSGWTGDGSKAGRTWRTRVIYQTNLATSYAAGRWQQLNDPDLVKLRPYWQYIHADGVMHPRPQHLAWHGLTLPREHAFWRTHFPPNGWGCHCRVRAVGQTEYDAAIAHGRGPDAAPEAGDTEGIDPGWAYAPGANQLTPFAQLVEKKLLNLEAPIGAEMMLVLGPVMEAEIARAVEALVDRVAVERKAGGASTLVHFVSPATVAALQRHEVELASSGIWLRDHEVLHALRDAKDERGRSLPLSAWRNLPALLAGARAWLDTADSALIYAFDLPEALGKVVVRVNYSEKVREGDKRARIVANFIRTGGTVEPFNLESGAQYIELGT